MKRRYYLDLANFSFKLRMKIGVGYGDFGADRIEITVYIIAYRY